MLVHHAFKPSSRGVPGRAQTARAGLAEWRTRRQRLSAFGGSADVVEEGVSESGKWREKRISRYRAGRAIGDGGRR